MFLLEHYRILGGIIAIKIGNMYLENYKGIRALLKRIFTKYTKKSLFLKNVIKYIKKN